MLSSLLLAAALAPSAPVPAPHPNADRVRLEALWTDLASYDPVARTKAAFALADHPAGVKFLAEKAPPVQATAKQIKGWLADLNSEDEKEAEAAFAKLHYFHPELALTHGEQLEQVSTDAGRHRLATLWWGEPITRHDGFVGNKLTVTGHDSFAFDQYYRGPNGASASDTNGTLFDIAHMRPDDWRRAALAAIILDRIDTNASRAALDKLADGHPDALPTRTAVAIRRARFALPNGYDDSWQKLLDFDPIQTTRWAFELADHPERVQALKRHLPAITATKEEVTGWLKTLNSDKAEEWKPAFEKLLYFHPQLYDDVAKQIDTFSTDHGRLAYFTLWSYSRRVPDQISAVSGTTLAIVNNDLWCSYPSPPGRRGLGNNSSVRLRRVEDEPQPHWQRARVAVLAFQRAGTPDAKAVLRQLAAGHPDILPTKEAKAALK